MNLGNSSNWVHWLSAVETGTLTSIVSSTRAIDPSFLGSFCHRFTYPGERQLTLEALHQAPGAREERAGQVKLEQIAHDEGVKAQFEGLFQPCVQLDGEPRKTNEVDDDVAREHRRHGRRKASVPAPLREPARENRRQHEPHDVPARRAGEDIPAVVSIGVDGSSERAHEEVEAEAPV